MAAKPTIANARFATGPGDDVVAPSSGLRDTGFVAGTPIVQSYVNYILEQLYLWCLYLSEGALSGDIVLDGDLSLTGAGAPDLVVTTGNITASAGNITATAGDITASSGDVVAENVRHTVEQKILISYFSAQPAVVASAINSVVTINETGISVDALTDTTFYPIPVRSGDVIKSWTHYVIKNSSAATTISAKLWKHTSGGGTSQIGSTQSSSANAPGSITLGQSGLTEVVGSAATYYLEFIPAGGANDAIDDLHVTVTRP